ncbi:MAG: DUF2934 domain-containing protein [Gammaproteobacteria bacterium]|jgi:hypothetical protein
MSVTAVSSKSKVKRAQTGRSSRRKSAKTTEPSEDDIRILAYSLYEQRSAEGIAGDASSDWIEAERQLRDE